MRRLRNTFILTRGNRYRSLTPKARLIPLLPPFLSYLRADGIKLPPEENNNSNDSDDEWSSPTENPTEDEEESQDPSLAWTDIHQKIKSTIAELGGSVTPKLNWSAPKDATWISATNSMECRTPNDIYLLLKSSDFITHDLEQVFDECESDSENTCVSASEEKEEEDKDASLSRVPYHLVLRKTIPAYNPSLEFRCFVRSRHLLCMCSRDLNHYSFLAPLIPTLGSLVQEFFNKSLQWTFPDENFVFDVYIPSPNTRVWLIDINPWAPRTDPLLFSWLEILNMHGGEQGNAHQVQTNGNGHGSPEPGEDESEEEEDVFTPEFRIVNRDDPEAYSFNTPQYSAHKMPKDVVDASADGGAGLREFMGTWREVLAKQEREDREENE